MLGNTKGWIIAGVLLAVEAGAVWSLLAMDRVSTPTMLGEDAANRAAIALPVSPATVVQRDRPGNAAAMIRAAVEAYESQPAFYDQFIERGDRVDIKRLAAVDQLIEATHIAGDRVLADRIEQAVVYDNFKPPVLVLEKIGNAAILAGTFLKRDKPYDALKYYAAAFSLGARMFDERLVWHEAQAGVGLMQTAAAGMIAALGDRDPPQSRRIQAFESATREWFAATQEKIWVPLKTSHGPTISHHAGDVFVFAQSPGERLWRVEAILKLGRMRYNIGENGRAGDQFAVMRVLKSIEKSETDPVILRALKLAKELDLETHRKIQ